MTLTPGSRLGPYEVQSAIGAGGMGEVYKARDTRLDRSVAIKVLPAHVSADPDRRARFEREAKTIAGLNHPHICTLHDVGEHDGTTYLVMEHLAGETLAERLQKGPLPLEQALTVATEIADALSAAHRQGVIHRDLKPGNVMLTKTGAKLLDFGLAKLKGHGEQPAAESLASAPTRTAPLTSEGTIIGTLQYMAPEQVEGKPADARTDLWALGAILYEMVTGKRAFEGISAASLIGNIMNAEPPTLATMKPLTPPALDRLVRRCLAKTPDERPDTAHDVADELRWLREAGGIVEPTGARPQRRRLLWIGAMVAGVIGGVIVGASLMWVLRPFPPVTSVVRSALLVAPADELNAGGIWSSPTPGGSRTAVAWIPDGQALVFVGRRAGVQQLYVRRLDAAEAAPIPNTTGAQVPAVSPDGQWVAFWAGGVIKKIRLGGGQPVDLATDISFPPWGLAWDTHRDLLIGQYLGSILKIPAEGQPVAVSTVGEGEVAHGFPSLLPAGRVLLYTVRRRDWSWGDEEVVALTLATGERKVVLRDAVDARYVSTGHLVFLRKGVLYAVPFDAERLERRGEEAPVLDGVAQALTGFHGGDASGAGQFAVASTGTLAWLPQGVPSYRQGRLVRIDRRGQVTPLAAPARSYSSVLRLSPDGRWLAVTILALQDVGLWLYDLSRPAPLLPLTTDGEARYPVWGRGGSELVFAWLENGRRALATQPADGTAPPRPLESSPVWPNASTADGRITGVVRGVASARDRDIVLVTVENGKARVEPLIRTAATEAWPQFSPDGRWLVYGSDATGRDEVYVRPHPGPGGVVPVSTEGGTDPAWHPNGRENFFLSPPDPAGKCRMMTVSFMPGSPATIGNPRELFSFDSLTLAMHGTPIRFYDVAPDGQAFYALQLVTSPSPPPVTHINLIQNWFEELKAKVPPGR